MVRFVKSWDKFLLLMKLASFLGASKVLKGQLSTRSAGEREALVGAKELHQTQVDNVKAKSFSNNLQNTIKNFCPLRRLLAYTHH